MGLFGILAGNTKTLDKIVGATIDGADALFHTEEEKAELSQKKRELFYKYLEISASESTTQSISRRLICLPVVYVWLLLVVANVIAAIFFPDVDSAVVTETISFMNIPALAAIGFYTGRHIVTEMKRR